MKDFEAKNWQVFNMFNNQWALVAAGSPDKFNTCTLSWGSLGTIWGNASAGRPIVTVYVRPDRYTCDFLKSNDTFTVSFFPEPCKKALGYLGTHSGRDGGKVAAAGLTPKSIGGSMGFEEANLTFVCHKLYHSVLDIHGMAPEIQQFYKDIKVDEPHWIFMGEILDIEDKR